MSVHRTHEFIDILLLELRNCENCRPLYSISQFCLAVILNLGEVNGFLNSQAKCYTTLNQVTAHSLVMDTASYIRTGSSIRIVQGSEHAVILIHFKVVSM